MIISKMQYKEIEFLVRKKFLDELIQRAKKNYPIQFLEYSEFEIREIINDLINSAIKFRIILDQNIIKYIDWHWMYGMTWLNSEKNKLIRFTLNCSFDSESYRIFKIENELKIRDRKCN